MGSTIVSGFIVLGGKESSITTGRDPNLSLNDSHHKLLLILLTSQRFKEKESDSEYREFHDLIFKFKRLINIKKLLYFDIITISSSGMK